MKKVRLSYLGILLIAGWNVTAQVAINTDGSGVGSSAILDVKSSNKGLLITRMTRAQIQAIAYPANGLTAYNTDDKRFYYFDGTDGEWKEIAIGAGTISSCYPITVTHVAGAIAPVAKTVTYGTVTNIPGETSKCWITQNLGASQQAMAVNDTTEASAGWYWQFNRKQGYKHDGTTRTPNTAWISSISENSDWTAAYDPCTLELGSGWRIPTSTEWTNVDAGGSWTSWTGPWNSGLKMHAAGWLMSYSNGNLSNRGYSGFYWSSTQISATYGWYLYFYSGNSEVTNTDKAAGSSLRCLRE